MNIKDFKIFSLVVAAVLMTSVSVSASEIDDRIESSARKSYVFKTYLKDQSIDVQSKNGVVTLKGTVSEEPHKSLAEETVANLPGVNRVDNQLEFDGERSEQSSDTWISMQVKYSLLYNRNVSGINTQVFVNDGIVTLKGEAENQAQKDLAGEYAKDIEGVQDVVNEMTIAEISRDGMSRDEISNQPKQTIGDKIDDASITAQVKMALLAHRSTSAFKTGVKTSNGIVTLSGETGSGAGKDMAGKVAGDVHGVITVMNNMTIDETLSRR